MSETTAYISQAHVHINGTRNPDVSANAEAALVEETVEGLFRCEIIVNNFGNRRPNQMDYLFFDREILDFGREVDVRLGGPPASVFTGRITALEAQYPPNGNSRLIILAEDRLQDLRMTRRTRNFEDLNDADIIAQVTREHGLTADINVDGPTHRSVAQVNQSDLAFIRGRARAVNAELWVTDTTLHVKPRTRQDATPIDLAYGVGLTAFQVRADLAHQCTELSLSGWDVANKTALQETVGASALSTEINGIGGSQALSDAFGSRVASVVDTVPLTVSEARALADAHYKEKARRFVTGSGQADGNTRLKVGKYVNLSGLGMLFDGVYYLTRVRHLFDLTNGYRTEFDAERADIGR